jgi:flagella basal body P-ring formation protein FlgA
MAGVALQDGAVGDRIQARNSNSRRVVEGIVGADGIIRVR